MFKSHKNHFFDLFVYPADLALHEYILYCSYIVKAALNLC